MLEVRHLTKRFGAHIALRDVSLSLERQRTHCLLGSSGSGKSTLLRAMLGLVPVDQGEIRWAGQDLVALTADRRANLIGYMPQEGGLFPHLTAFDNVSLVARLQGWSRERIDARVDELIQIVALDRALLARFPHELSGGQRQRVALLRAAFLDASLLLMDEPLGALDPLVRADLQQELRDSFARLRKTVIFVTHDLGEAAYLGDDIILMHEGRIVQTGTMHELQAAPADPFVTRFLNAQRVLHGGEGA